MKYSAYPKYKPSGIEWLGDVPEHWEVKRGRYCMSVNPQADRLRKLKSADEVSFIPMEAVGENGGLNLDVTRPLGEIGSSYTEFQDGDIIVAKITPCFENGKGALASGLQNGVALGTTELHVLRPLPHLEGRFLFYLTLSSVYRKLGEAEMYGAGGQKRVPYEFNKNFAIPLPPLSEQRVITHFMEAQTVTLDTLVAKKRELIEKLKEKRAALISRTITRGIPPEAARAADLDPHPKFKPSGVEWLGDIPEHWEVLQLRRRFIILDCKHRTVPFVDGGIPLVSIQDVQGVEIDLSNAKQTTEEEYLQMIEGDRKPQLGDIIYSRNVTVGAAALVDTKARFCIGQDVCLIRCRGQFPRYVLYLFRSSALTEQVESLMIGSTFRRINVSQIKSFWICLPPTGEQRALADYLDNETRNIDRMVEKVEAAVERLQE